MMQDQFIFAVAASAALAAIFLLLSFCAYKVRVHKARLEERVREETRRRKRTAVPGPLPIEVS